LKARERPTQPDSTHGQEQEEPYWAKEERENESRKDSKMRQANALSFANLPSADEEVEG
jgi:hypothetical protein